MNKKESASSSELGSDGGFSVRLARRLALKANEGRTFTLESSKGSVKITIGKPAAGGKRPVRIEGILRWYGMEYEIAVDDLNGSGVLGPRDRASLFDRTANHFIEGDLPARVYQTLIPLIELEADDLLSRARARKH